MSTTTTNLGLTLPTPNVDTGWGSTLNTDFTLIDDLFEPNGNGTSVGLNVGSGKTLLLGGTMLLGTGDGTGTTAAPTIRGPARTGTDVAGSDLTISAANGTGTGGSGKIILRTAPVGTSGTTANTLRSAFEVNAAGGIGVNGANYGTSNQVLLSGGSSATANWGAVDGSVISISGQTRGDIIFRGASAWQRLAAGTSGQVLKTNGNTADPSWTNILTQSAAQTFASGGNTFTGIPSTANTIVMAITALDSSSTYDVLVRVGTSSGVSTSGYTSAGTIVSTNPSTSTATNGFLLNVGGAVVYGTVRLTNVSGNTWVCDYTLTSYSSSRSFIGGGVISLGGTLERVSILSNGGTFAASGSASIIYM